MTAPQLNRAQFDRREWNIMAYRLILAHLEPDREQGYWFKELVRMQCGFTEDEFLMADRLAFECVRAFPTDCLEAAREDYTKRLDRIT